MDEMNLDEMIALYSDELMKLKRNGEEGAGTSETDIPQKEEEIVENSQESEIDMQKSFFVPKEDFSGSSYGEESAQEQQEDTETEQIQNEEAPVSTANFFARVFSGESAFPVLGAKVLLKRNDELYKVLTTSASGETRKIKIASYKKENSLRADGENQRYDYLADVYADGFVTQKDLLVSAVGESEIILTVQMIPVSERID